jgi:hypothetical protein
MSFLNRIIRKTNTLGKMVHADEWMTSKKPFVNNANDIMMGTFNHNSVMTSLNFSEVNKRDRMTIYKFRKPNNFRFVKSDCSECKGLYVRDRYYDLIDLTTLETLEIKDKYKNYMASTVHNNVLYMIQSDDVNFIRYGGKSKTYITKFNLSTKMIEEKEIDIEGNFDSMCCLAEYKGFLLMFSQEKVASDRKGEEIRMYTIDMKSLELYKTCTITTPTNNILAVLIQLGVYGSNYYSISHINDKHAVLNICNLDDMSLRSKTIKINKGKLTRNAMIKSNVLYIVVIVNNTFKMYKWDIITNKHLKAQVLFKKYYATNEILIDKIEDDYRIYVAQTDPFFLKW